MKRFRLTEKLSYFDLEDGGGLFCLEPGYRNTGAILKAVEDREAFAKWFELLKEIES